VFVHLLRDNKLLLLFLVAAIGYLVGRVKFRGVSLGVAAVLFVGLAFGGLHPDLALPELVHQFGLVLFVYTVGLSSGPGFFASMRKRGVRDNGMVLAGITLAAAVSVVVVRAIGRPAATAAGIFAGAVTNTPALASVIETLRAHPTPNEGDPVVAYSLAYPFGVLGVLCAIVIARKVFAVDLGQEPMRASVASPAPEKLANCTVRLGASFAAKTAAEARAALGGSVLFSRIERRGVVSVVYDSTRFQEGDLVSLVGAEKDLARATSQLGTKSDKHLELDRTVLDFRRVFVSNKEVTQRPLSTLELPQRFGAVITRIRRGDTELLPDGETELELGDRVRVVAPRDNMEEIARYLGDSYKALSEIDVITFSLGIAMGLAVGAVGVPLPGGATFKLGTAGGPLVVGLLLGRLGRTGQVVWTLPYSANLTLRQVGLVLFLAGVGTRSGFAFFSTLRQGGALPVMLAGAATTVTLSFFVLAVGYKLLKIPLSILVGMLSGAHTQPAALAFACEQTRNELPHVGYATVFPLATIAKILLAQGVLALAR
jgi:putative transport protein